MARTRDYRRENLATRYGITVEEFETQMRRQNGKCPICLRDFVMSVEDHRSATNPVVDHDHDHDFLRGILCQECNKAIGRVGDSLAGIEPFLAYLRNPTWQCTGQLDLFADSVT